MSTGDTTILSIGATASQMRALAVQMAGSQAAILMNDLAADYEKLAEQSGDQDQGEKAAIEWQAALGRVRFRQADQGVGSKVSPFSAFRFRYWRMIWRHNVALPTLYSVANRSSRSKSGISSGIVTVRVAPGKCYRALAACTLVDNACMCNPPFPISETRLQPNVTRTGLFGGGELCRPLYIVSPQDIPPDGFL